MPAIAPLLADFEIKTTYVAGGVNPQQVLAKDPNRWGVLFSATSGKDVFLAFDATVAGGQGIRVPTTGVATFFYFSVHGALPTQPWWMDGSGTPGNNLFIVEILYKPAR